MPNLRDDHLPPVGHLTPVYPYIFCIKALYFENVHRKVTCGDATHTSTVFSAYD
jgi:hypothetical protein